LQVTWFVGDAWDNQFGSIIVLKFVPKPMCNIVSGNGFRSSNARIGFDGRFTSSRASQASIAVMLIRNAIGDCGANGLGLAGRHHGVCGRNLCGCLGARPWLWAQPQG
jgi:hypothetical protein